jgi:hypothetical protein
MTKGVCFFSDKDARIFRNAKDCLEHEWQLLRTERLAVLLNRLYLTTENRPEWDDIYSQIHKLLWELEKKEREYWRWTEEDAKERDDKV